MSGTITPLGNPAGAVSAYNQVASGGASSFNGFGDFMSNLIHSTIHQSTTTEQAAKAGLMGQGDLTHIVASVAQAQVALQTTVAIRDRLIQSYQSIMNMPI